MEDRSNLHRTAGKSVSVAMRSPVSLFLKLLIEPDGCFLIFYPFVWFVVCHWNIKCPIRRICCTSWEHWTTKVLYRKMGQPHNVTQVESQVMHVRWFREIQLWNSCVFQTRIQHSVCRRKNGYFGEIFIYSSSQTIRSISKEIDDAAPNYMNVFMFYSVIHGTPLQHLTFSW